MSISAAIQKHYQRESTLLIPLAIDSVRHTFVRFSTIGIERGTFWSPLAPYYRLNVQWDGNIAHLDGPNGMKVIPLTTKATLQPSMSRDCTTLNLSMQLPLKYIGTSLTVLLLITTFSLCLPVKYPDKLIIFLFWILMFYGLSWLHFFYSSNLILKCLSEEFLIVDRDAR
jgi:hypothetical protein